MTDTELDSLYQLVRRFMVATNQEMNSLLPRIKLQMTDLNHPDAAEIDLYGSSIGNYELLARVRTQLWAEILDRKRQ